MSKRISLWAILFTIGGLMSASLVTVAQSVTRSSSGTIDATTPFVEVAFSVTEANSTITLDLMPTSGDLDTLVYLLDEGGNIIDQNDDRIRGDVSSLLVYPSAEVGQYRAVATRYGVEQGNTTGTFDLALSVTPPVTAQEIIYDVSPEAILAAGFPDTEIRPEAEWTILAYYGGDTDLEPGVLNDFKEFEAAGGSTQAVRIVMLADRNPGFTDAYGNWTSTKVFEVQAGGGDILASTELVDLGPDKISSDGQLLAQYLVWAIRHFPAKQYAVAFASHGAAWEGLIQDDTPLSNDASPAEGEKIKNKISLTELRQAFELATQAAGIERFSVLVNDACLMSAVEYYAVMDKFFTYSFASPEVVIDPALNMTEFANLLNQDPSGDLVEFGKRLVDTYIDTDIRRVSSPDIVFLTHSVTDLGRFDPVVQAIEAFAATFNENPQQYAIAVGNARKNTYTYSGFLGSETKVDLGDLMKRIVDESKSVELDDAASAVLDALTNTKLYTKNGGAPELANASYYNIYFPETVEYFRSNSYFGVTPLQEWAQMLRNYYSAVTPKVWSSSTNTDFHPPVAPTVNIATLDPVPSVGKASIWSPVTMRAEVFGRNIAHVDTTIDQLQPDGTYIRLSTERLLEAVVDEDGNFIRQNTWAEGVNVRDVGWDVTLPVITDGTVIANEYIVFTEEVAYMEGYYRPTANDPWRDVTLIFNVVNSNSGQKGTVQRVISRSATSESAANIAIPEGADFVAFRNRVTPDGVAVLELSQNYMKWPLGGITYEWQPAPNGTYKYGMLATAFGGTTGYASQTIEVDNTNLDFSLRGVTNAAAGFTLVRPDNWTPLIYTIGGLEPTIFELYRTTSPDGTFSDSGESNADGTQNFTVYVISEFDNNGEPLPNDLQYIADLFVSLGAMTVTSDFVSETVQSFPALTFSYRYSATQGTFNGKATVVYNTYIETATVISAEVLDGSGAIVDDVYALLSTNFGVFDTQGFYEQRDAQQLWAQVGTDTIGFYRPRQPQTWGIWENGDWTGLSENGVLEDGSFFAFKIVPTDASVTGIDFVRQVTQTDVAQGRESLTIVADRAYSNASSWDAVIYTATRNGQAVKGRVYAQARPDGNTTILWVESTDDEAGLNTMVNRLEPMVDSFVFYE